MKTVIEMAREAGDDEWKILVRQVMKHFPDEFERFAELVRADAIADEREQIIDLVAFYGGPVDLEAAIRARGNT